MFSLDRVLSAAINAMVHGRHAPHCYSAHVPGKGYVNYGGPPFDRADYLRQLKLDATSEVENMNYAQHYADPGYHDAAPKGILFADWNKFPSSLDRILERMGYAVEWSDEWSTCEDCNGAVRTEPSGYWWAPYYAIVNDRYGRPMDDDDGSTVLCVDCLCEWAHGKRAEELESTED